MAVSPSSAPVPGFSPPDQDRRRVRRLLIAGSIAVALVLIGVAAVYAGTRSADGRQPDAQLIQPSAVSTAPPGLPSYFLPTEQPEPGFGCMQVLAILSDMIGVDVDYVETRRAAADRLRGLEAGTSSQRAALEELADELDAAAQMVEDDPSAEQAAFDRESAASDAFVESGVC